MYTNSHMTERIAKLISLITEPGLVFLIGVAVLQFQVGPTDYIKGGVFVLVSAIPVVFAIIRQYFRPEGDLTFTQLERNEIYLSAVFGFALGTLIFGSQVMLSTIWMNVAMIFTILSVVFYLTNHYFDKASIHVGMLVIWCMLLVEMVSINYALGLALLVPVTWSRLHLRKHTWPQIMWGLSLGLSVGVLAWIAL